MPEAQQAALPVCVCLCVCGAPCVYEYIRARQMASVIGHTQAEHTQLTLPGAHAR